MNMFHILKSYTKHYYIIFHTLTEKKYDETQKSQYFIKKKIKNRITFINYATSRSIIITNKDSLAVVISKERTFKNRY